MSNSPLFDGKSVLVTGSSKGIGHAIANSFLTEGAYVAFNSRSISDLKKITSIHPRSIAVCADVTIPEDATRAVNEVVDHLVN